MTFRELPGEKSKLISSLKLKKKRDEYKLFIGEGEKICRELISSHYEADSIIIKENCEKKIIVLADLFTKKNVPVYYAKEKVFNKICDAVTPQDIVSVVKYNDDLPQKDENFVALDGISDPGNFGTIIRTAEWFGFKQIVLSHDCVDKYNPKVVRSTMGSLFRMSIIPTTDLTVYLKNNFPKHSLYGATLNAKNDITNIQKTKKFGLVFGNESRGISETMGKILNFEFKIEGKNAESLNVAVAAGIALFYFSQV